MKVSIGSDHAGVELKGVLKEYLETKGFEVTDFGPSTSDSVDYPDYGHKIAHSVEQGEAEFGIAICGSGNGINMTVNKHQGVRSALCWNEEIASLAKAHNNANVIALPARFVSSEEAIRIVEAYVDADYEGGRHQRRVEKIPCATS